MQAWDKAKELVKTGFGDDGDSGGSLDRFTIGETAAGNTVHGGGIAFFGKTDGDNSSEIHDSILSFKTNFPGILYINKAQKVQSVKRPMQKKCFR